MEFSFHGSLKSHLATLNESERIKIGTCTCNGLDFLHTIGIAHRDLKPENILLFGDKTLAKLSDIGSSKIIQKIMITTTGGLTSPKYTAPELLSNSELFCLRFFPLKMYLITIKLVSNEKSYFLKLLYHGCLLDNMY